jgi:TM2 domain-containing membrane protein YozV/predicted RNA-binding Zn-ribbon protein involved in translation (DUF1610 family)
MSNLIQFECGSCGKTLKADQNLGGKKCKCSNCGNILLIPLIQTYVDIQHQNNLVTHMKSKYCHYCGSVISALAEICPKCGVRQHEMGISDNRTSKDSPSKIAACLFAIFLGVFGAHKFYLGKIGMGVLYLVLSLLLCWTIIVPLLIHFISMIEGIVYLSYSDKKFADKYSRDDE